MALLDLLDRYQGRGISTPSSVTGQKSFGPSGPMEPFDGTGAASNSRERGAPERFDINDFVPQINRTPIADISGDPEPDMGALQVAEVAGRTPGFVLERPLALLDQLGGNKDEGGIIDSLGEFGPFKAAGEALLNISTLPGSIANASTADSLRRGFTEGWADETPIESTLDRLGRTTPLGIILGTNDAEKRGMGGPKTWGEFKADAARKGWTVEDVEDLIAGRKQTYDYGDHAISSDPMTELGVRIATDPLNLLFGAGVALKVVKGAGLLGKAIKAGAVAEKMPAPSLAAIASRQGISAESTWFGLARYAGQVGRGLGAVPGGAGFAGAAATGLSAAGRAGGLYKKGSLATTGVQLGLTAADQLTEGGTQPRSGFLEGLFQFNQEVWDNQPLSQTSAFAIFSAFQFNPFHGLSNAVRAGKGVKTALLGSGVRSDVLKALQQGEAWGGKAPSRAKVLEAIGGPENLDNLIVHTSAQMAFERIMRNPAIKATLSHFDSIDEAILANRKLGEMIEGIIVNEYQSGAVSGRALVGQLQRWHGNRSGVKSGIDFPWDGKLAIDRWTEYGAAAAPVSDIFKARGDVVIGLVDSIMAEDIRNMGSALKIASAGEKTVSILEVRRWMNRFPQLAEDAWWSKFNLDEFNGQRIDLGKLQGKLRKLAKDAPTARDLTHEFAAAEWKAAQAEIQTPPPLRVEDLAPQDAPVVSVSRMRPTISKRLGMDAGRVDDIQAARGAPEVAAFEGNLGQALDQAGFDVDNVTQGMGAWGGSLEPLVEIAMPAGTIDDIRLAAAMVGRAGRQDAVVWAAAGPRLAELGLSPNGFETKFALPSTNRAALQAVTSLLSKEFDGFTINDTLGIVRILHPGGDRAVISAKLARLTPELEGLFPRDALGDSGIAASTHPAYVESLASKKGTGSASYGEVLTNSARAGDVRAGGADAFRSALTHRRAASRNAPAGVGPDEAVGRVPGDAGRAPGDLALAPEQRVGYGVDAPAAEAGYLYRSLRPEEIDGVLQDGLRPNGPESRSGKWTDGGSGKRTLFADEPANTEGVLLRVRTEDAGRVRRDFSGREPYSQKRLPDSLLEVYGGDGQWHPLDSWRQAALEPDLAAGAQQTLPVYQAVAEQPVASTISKLSYDEQHALQQYLSFLYPNKDLRAGKVLARSELMPDRPTRVEAIDAVFERSSVLAEPMTVYRSVSQAEFDAIAASGGTWTDPAYLSTAKTRALAEPYNAGPMVRIELPAGARALDIDRNVRPLMDILGDSLRDPDFVTGEVLLPRGSRFSVHWEGEALTLRLQDAGPATRNLLPDQPVFDPVPDPLTAGLRAIEDTPPARGVPSDEATLAAQLAALTRETVLSPEAEVQAQNVQRQLEATRLAKGEARSGAVQYMARRDAEVSSTIPLHRSLHGLPEAVQAELVPFERHLREHYPAYTLQKAPQPAILMGDRGGIAGRYLRDRTVLGEVIAEWGVFGKMNRLIEWLGSPVKNEQLGRQARQALMNELVPKGAKPAEILHFLDALEKQAALHTIGPFEVRAFRNGTSMTAKAINRIAGGDAEVGIPALFSQKVVAAVGRQNFARTLDRAGNRFIRTMDTRAARGGASGQLAAGIAKMYDAYSKTTAGDLQRMVSKTLYHWFRFISDPRWWAMNMLEADIIGGAKYGIGSTRFKGAHKAAVSDPALLHQHGTRGPKELALALDDANGWMYTRRMGGYISRSFDDQRPETVLKLLRELPDNDPVLGGLRDMVRTEDAAAGRLIRTAGEITDDDLVQAIDRALYSFDTKGAKATILEEAHAILGPDETLQMMPFLQKVWEANDKTYRGIVELFHGNSSRTNLERIANSYWLYWPLSYQIKATKWLARTLGEGAFGVKTNLGGAALYAHHYEEHKRRMSSDPGYVQLFADNPTAWFVAQMMVPVTPGDVGVSLSRPVRYAGGALGIWGDYKSADDPISAAGAIISLGPVYTAELLARLGRETFDETTANLYP